MPNDDDHTFFRGFGIILILAALALALAWWAWG